MRKPLQNPDIFKVRRQKVFQNLGNSSLILVSPPETKRSGPYRQDSNLFFLTGFDEPESILILRGGEQPKAILFVRPKDKLMETWEGFRYGPDLTREFFGVEEAYLFTEFAQKAPLILKGSESVFYRVHRHPAQDDKVFSVLEATQALHRRSGLELLPIYDPDLLLRDFRVVKDSASLQSQRRACEISAQAHLEVLKYARPGMNEREIHGYFLYQSLKQGASREGYNGIVASGPNACTLHYVFNDQDLKAGDFLLIDCGAEFEYHTGDITRTFPVGAKFTAAQKIFYNLVLEVQKKIISQVKPGLPYRSLQQMGVQYLVEAMLELGLVTGSVEEIINSKSYTRYYPHGIGHFLGMDVHDVGAYENKLGQATTLEPHMVFTIEPGLYVPADDSTAPSEFRGLGVRIEDNILVTAGGFEVLTEKAPKEVSDIESFLK